MARKPGSKNRLIVNGKYECKVCGAFKEAAEFYPCKNTKCGLRCRCRKCDIEIINARHTNNLDRALRDLLLHHKANGVHGSPRRQVFTQQGGLTPEILHEMWKSQNGRCAVTGVQLTHVQGKGYRVWTNVTVDRIDCDRGYERDNIRLVCRAVNYMKAAMTDAEMLEWCRAIIHGLAPEYTAS